MKLEKIEAYKLVTNNEDKVMYIPSQMDGYICIQEFWGHNKTLHIRAKYVAEKVEKMLMESINELEDI